MFCECDTIRTHNIALGEGNTGNFVERFLVIRKKQDKKSSRNRDGKVPNANWNDDKFNVNWYNADNHNPNLRARAEVSHEDPERCYGFSCMYLIQPFTILEIS